MEQLQLLPEFISNHLILVGAFVLVLMLLVKAEFEHQTGKGFQLDPTNATRLMNAEGTLVIDVRSDAEYAKAHIKGAKNAPQAYVQQKLEKMTDSKNDTILLYCNIGNTSARVCRMLLREGYLNVKNIKGGFVAWQEANLPVSKK